MEQQVDLLTTAESCSVLEEGILTPMLHQWVDFDHQFRDQEVTVRTYGELGQQAKMEAVSPLQTTNRFGFAWFGVEQARNAQAQQQQIALLNVARGMAPDLQRAGYSLNPAPALEHAAGNVFGWRMGRLIIVDQRTQLSVDPQLENELLRQGMDVNIHMLDPDPQHIQTHMPLTQDPNPVVAAAAKIHVQLHQASLAAKNQAQQMQQMQQGMGGPPRPPGQPGGGQPQPGGQVPGPRLMRGPAGMIHQDQLSRAGALTMPRAPG